MSTPNFVDRKPMDSAQKSYQLEGHAKYVDIARLFGWKVLGDYWRSWVEDFEAGRPWSKHGMDSDKLSLRLSQKAGADLTPLLHFWGIPPRDAKPSRQPSPPQNCRLRPRFTTRWCITNRWCPKTTLPSGPSRPVGGASHPRPPDSRLNAHTPSSGRITTSKPPRRSKRRCRRFSTNTSRADGHGGNELHSATKRKSNE